MAIREYRNSDALLSELGDSYLEGFDDALRQIKKAFRDLDVSNIKVEDQAQTSVMPIASEDTEDLFAEDVNQDDGGPAQAQNVQGQAQHIGDDTRQRYLFCLMAYSVVFMQQAHLIWVLLCGQCDLCNLDMI